MFGPFSFSFFAGQRNTTITAITAIPNVSVWFDASTPTYFTPTNPSDGTGITNWNDKSGASHNASPVGGASNRPVYRTGVYDGFGGLTFNGTSQNLQINNTTWARSLSGFTLFIVASAATLSGVRTLTQSDQDGMKIYHTGTAWATKTAGGTGVSTVAGSTTGFHILTQIFDGTLTGDGQRLKLRYDKSPVDLTFTGTVSANTSASTNQLYYAWDNFTSPASNYFKGTITEIMMFTRALNSNEIINVESYLANKWGV